MKSTVKIFSRLLDYLCFWSILLFTIDFFDFDVVYYLVITALIPLLFIPVEAFCVRYFGRTFGRYLCGLKYDEIFTWKSALTLAYRKATFRSAPARLIKQKPKRIAHIAAIFLACLIVFPDATINQTSKVLPFKFLQDLRAHRNGGVDVPPGWTKLTGNDLPFHVFFPSTPKFQEIKESVPHSTHTLVYREYSENGYSAAYVELPNSWVTWGSSIVFKGTLKQVASYEKGEIIDKRKATHDGLPALEYKIKRGSEITSGKLILSGNTIYKLETNDNEHPEIFFNTFQLQK